jgi:hypothetical protein
MQGMITRASAVFPVVVTIVSLGGVACSAGGPSSSETGDASTDASAAYDGPFDLPDGHAVTLPLTGCGGPGYAAEFKVGSQAFQLSVDTGSGTLAVAATSCDTCDVSPLYEPGSAAVDEQEQTSDDYLMGSWKGEVYSDSVRLLGLNEEVKMDLAAIDSQSAFFKDGGCAFGTIPFAPQGIVGFGPPGLSSPGTSAFWTKLTQSGAVRRVFAVEVCSSGGLLMVGGVDPARGALRGPALYTPIADSSYYSVALTDLQVSGVSLGFGASDFGTAAVDTGSSVLALPPAAFDALESRIQSGAAFSTAFDGQKGWLGTTTCLTSSLDRAEIDSELPTLTLAFPRVGGGTLALDLHATDSYLAPTVSGGTTYYCSGIFRSTGPTVLGTAVMAGHLVIFDLEEGKIGFAPQAFCP